MSVHGQAKKVTTHTLQEMKRAGEKITMLTAYDYSLAKLVDNGGVDVILVGDSASNVMAGQVTTVPMTLDHMIYHAQCVKRAVDRALIVVDMPFGTYQGNSAIALESAIRIMKEAEGHAVKLEGGAEIVESIKRILTAGIPVMGHLGLTPQSIYKFGTYTVRAKEDGEAAKLIEDAGAFSIILECMTSSAAKFITKKLKIPTIGIGSSSNCDGQILVTDDMLGISGFYPKFVKKYTNLNRIIEKAIKKYTREVKQKKFPKLTNFLDGRKNRK